MHKHNVRLSKTRGKRQCRSYSYMYADKKAVSCPAGAV